MTVTQVDRERARQEADALIQQIDKVRANNDLPAAERERQVQVIEAEIAKRRAITGPQRLVATANISPRQHEAIGQATRLIQEIDRVRADPTLDPVTRAARVAAIEGEIAVQRRISRGV